MGPSRVKEARFVVRERRPQHFGPRGVEARYCAVPPDVVGFRALILSKERPEGCQGTAGVAYKGPVLTRMLWESI